FMVSVMTAKPMAQITLAFAKSVLRVNLRTDARASVRPTSRPRSAESNDCEAARQIQTTLSVTNAPAEGTEATSAKWPARNGHDKTPTTPATVTTATAEVRSSGVFAASMAAKR